MHGTYFNATIAVYVTLNLRLGKDEVTSSNLVSSSKMTDPTQFEQVNETCEFGGVVVYSESLGMTGFSRVGMSKRMRDIKIQPSQNVVENEQIRRFEHGCLI